MTWKKLLNINEPSLPNKQSYIIKQQETCPESPAGSPFLSIIYLIPFLSVNTDPSQSLNGWGGICLQVCNGGTSTCTGAAIASSGKRLQSTEVSPKMPSRWGEPRGNCWGSSHLPDTLKTQGKQSWKQMAWTSTCPSAGRRACRTLLHCSMNSKAKKQPWGSLGTWLQTAWWGKAGEKRVGQSAEGA